MGTVLSYIELIFLHKMAQHERGYQIVISEFHNFEKINGKIVVFHDVIIVQKT